MSNVADIRATVLRLEEYHRTGKVSKRETRKLTAVLSREQYDLLTRLAILENDSSVPLGHVSFREDDVVPLNAPYGHLLLFEVEAPLLATLLRYGNRKHARPLDAGRPPRGAQEL